MSPALSLLRRLPAVGALLISGLLAGCATYPPSYYQDAYPQGGGYAGDYYYGNDYSYGGYGYGYGGYGYNGWYGGYYSALWPIWFNYYAPWYPYGFYYGISYFPYGWYGLSFAYYDDDYHHYSPYRHSWDDNQDDWYGGTDWRQDPGDGTPRFGSARNEAERLSQLTRAQRGLQATGTPGNWSRARDDGTRGPASAPYNPRLDAQSRSMSPGQPSAYQRGISGHVAGAPARGARGGFAAPAPADAQRQQQYRHMPGVPGYQPSAPAAGQAQGAQAYSRGRDAGSGGGHQPAPPSMHVAPSPGPSMSSGMGRSSGSASSRGGSGSWSRGRDDGGNPD